MEIEQKGSIRSRYADQLGDQTGGDGDSRLILLVGPAIAEIRDHRRHPPRRCPLDGIDHDQHLHDRVVDRGGEGLHDKDVVLADAFVDAHECVVVRKLEDFRATERDADIGTDLLGQLRIGIAGKDN